MLHGLALEMNSLYGSAYAREAYVWFIYYLQAEWFVYRM